jgi:hypothetical protein
VGKWDYGSIDDRQTNTAVGHAEPRTLRGREGGEREGAGKTAEIAGPAAGRDDIQVPPCMRNALEAKLSNALKDGVIGQE